MSDCCVKSVPQSDSSYETFNQPVMDWIARLTAGLNRSIPSTNQTMGDLERQILQQTQGLERKLLEEASQKKADQSPPVCPVCGNKSDRLNGTVTGEVYSFLVLTLSRKRLVIGCVSCLDKANDRALTKTALLGWWGIPWGPLFTIATIINNSSLKHDYTNNILQRLVQQDQSENIAQHIDSSKCPNCNLETLPNASFCKSCGTKLNF